MIVTNDSVNVIALPYVWQLTDNYGYAHCYLQTNTPSQMVAIHSWPDFDHLPWGREANLSENEASVARGHGRGRGQILRGQGQVQKIWPWGHVGLEDLTSLHLMVFSFAGVACCHHHHHDCHCCCHSHRSSIPSPSLSERRFCVTQHLSVMLSRCVCVFPLH